VVRSTTAGEVEMVWGECLRNSAGDILLCDLFREIICQLKEWKDSTPAPTSLITNVYFAREYVRINPEGGTSVSIPLALVIKVAPYEIMILRPLSTPVFEQRQIKRAKGRADPTHGLSVQSKKNTLTAEVFTSFEDLDAVRLTPHLHIESDDHELVLRAFHILARATFNGGWDGALKFTGAVNGANNCVNYTATGAWDRVSINRFAILEQVHTNYGQEYRVALKPGQGPNQSMYMTLVLTIITSADVETPTRSKKNRATSSTEAATVQNGQVTISIGALQEMLTGK
jgi:hypothetical protein